MDTSVLKETILNLIDSKKEGDYWDFKQQYPTNNARFIHDIICLGNNTTGNDGLLIFGVEDWTYQVLGIESDLNRKKQANVLDLLNNGCKFDGSCPSIELYTIIIDSCEIDVWLIKHYENMPYRLVENYNHGKDKIVKGITHTRRGDVNTPIDKNGASASEMKILWGGLNKPSFEISLISDDENIAEKTYSYKSPKKLANRNSLWRISEEELQINPAISWKSATAGDMIKHQGLGNLAGGITEADNLTDEEIEEYNNKLPSQEEVDKYNNEQSLYENAQNNCFNFFLHIKNIGKTEANNIDIRLFFPEGLLVYYKDEIKDIKEPDVLEFPDHPIFAKNRKNLHAALGFSNIARLANSPFSQFSSYGGTRSIKALYQGFDLKASQRTLDIYGDNSSLELKLPNLLHTRDFCSNEFGVIATKSGAFKIEYDIICKELTEPQTGEFVLNIVQYNNNP